MNGDQIVFVCFMKIVIGLAEMDFILTLLAILTVIKNDKKIKKKHYLSILLLSILLPMSKVHSKVLGLVI